MSEGYLTALWYKRGNTKGDLSDDPQFENAGYVGDWRNFVGKFAQQAWKSLSMEHRAAIALDADDKAKNEDWS